MKYKIKDKNKEAVVKAYQNQIRFAIENIESKNDKLSVTTKEYIKNLELNIKRAPFTLGWYHWPIKKK